MEKFSIKYCLWCSWIATNILIFSSSLMASCVARFMICEVCKLYFSGLVCLMLSLDECLIKINNGRFCVAPMKLCPLMWHRVWLICNIKGCFHLTMIFNKRWLSSLFNGLVAVNFLRTLDKWKFFQCLEKVILWIHLCFGKGEFRYHH